MRCSSQTLGATGRLELCQQLVFDISLGESVGDSGGLVRIERCERDLFEVAASQPDHSQIVFDRGEDPAHHQLVGRLRIHRRNKLQQREEGGASGRAGADEFRIFGQLQAAYDHESDFFGLRRLDLALDRCVLDGAIFVASSDCVQVTRFVSMIISACAV